MTRITEAELIDGQVPVQDVPETSSDQRMHVLDVDCWCEPTVESVPPAQPRVIHKSEDPT